jgi:Ser/Thr protein kinase RdoA (MazF antagonist)
MIPVSAWAGLDVIGPLTGGNRTPVLLARRGERRLVVRRSGRSPDALDWELDLLAHLVAYGVDVPALVPADDGRRHVEGVLVQEFVDGRQPASAHDWRLVVDVLRVVHRVTTGWPQRPGFAAAEDLLVTERGGDVALDAMPADGVRAVRAAWRPVLTGPRCAIHADLGASNVLISGERVTLLDWDESRVDVPWFDFAFLPEPPPDLPVAWADLVAAGVAWEAATCWLPEPAYARSRLAELYERPARPAPLS